MTYPLKCYASVRKEFAFSASHQLTGLPEEHPCSRLHGHNYRVEVEIEGLILTPPGFVIDYRELDFVKRELDDRWDHRHLNEVVPFNPTAEHMASHLADWIAGQLAGHRNITRVAVHVSETPKTWATASRYIHAERDL